MQLLTEDALITCGHLAGRVEIAPTQELVSIGSRRILVEKNPEGRVIQGCPNIGPAIKPCRATLLVHEGYSSLLRIQGRRICVSTLWGLTDGTPPGTVRYEVRDPGQTLVSERP